MKPGKTNKQLCLLSQSIYFKVQNRRIHKGKSAHQRSQGAEGAETGRLWEMEITLTHVLGKANPSMYMPSGGGDMGEEWKLHPYFL